MALLACAGVLAAALVAATVFGPGWLLVAIEREAQQYLKPRLRIDGPLSWQLWPQPSLTLARLLLLDDAGQPQLKVESVRIEFAPDALSAAVVPLALLEIRGVDAVISQDAEGGWNVGDWLVERSDAQAQAVLPFRSLSISDGRVRVSTPENAFELDRITIKLDQETGEPAWLDLSLTARIHSTDSPALELEADAGARLHVVVDGVRLSAPRLALSGQVGEWLLEHASVSGEGGSLKDGGSWVSGPITLDVAARRPLDVLSASLTLDRLEASAAALGAYGLKLDIKGNLAQGAIQANLSATDLQLDAASWVVAGLTADTRYSGASAEASVSFSGDATGVGFATEHHIEANIRDGRAALPHPRNPAHQLSLRFGGALGFDLPTGSADGRFAGGFDQSLFELEWAWLPVPSAVLTARMEIDRLTLDAYLPSDASSPGTASDFSLPQWQDWPISAELRVGTLEFRGLVSRDARLSINAEAAP